MTVIWNRQKPKRRSEPWRIWPPISLAPMLWAPSNKCTSRAEPKVSRWGQKSIAGTANNQELRAYGPQNLLTIKNFGLAALRIYNFWWFSISFWIWEFFLQGILAPFCLKKYCSTIFAKSRLRKLQPLKQLLARYLKKIFSDFHKGIRAFLPLKSIV